MQILDNINNTIKDDLQKEVKKGSKISIAAACFSIYAYQELKKQLEGVEELHFIFTSPTFITEKTPKAKREFYIPRLSRERSLYGTEFEVKLRNELTQKAIAKECAEWIRKKVVFKSNITQEQMMGFITVDESTYMPINGFTTVDLGCERGNNAYYPVQKTESFENARTNIKILIMTPVVHGQQILGKRLLAEAEQNIVLLPLPGLHIPKYGMELKKHSIL